MYSALLFISLFAFVLQAVLAYSAGNRSLRLARAKDAAALRKETARLRLRMVLITIAALLPAGASILYAVLFPPLFWLDRAALALAFGLLPAVLLWTAAWPRLRQLSLTSGPAQPGLVILRAADGFDRGQAASQWITLPFRAASLCALAALYFTLVRPVPFRFGETAVPLAYLAAAIIAAWLLHARRARLIAAAAGSAAVFRPSRERIARLLCLAAAVAAAVPLLTAAAAGSKLPDDIDMSSGHAEYGRGSKPAAHAGHGQVHLASAASADTSVSVTELAGSRTDRPDRRITLTAVKTKVRLSSGRMVDAWTYNGQIPGPELRFKQGETVEVTLRNENVAEGVTIHWHGLDVPNAEDGVAGVTQDAVMPGETHVYRFRAEQAGTFWYHSHQHSNEAVQRGLFGALVVEPKEAAAAPGVDLALATHLWEDAGLAVNEWDELRRMAVPAGTPVRLRLINTDDWVRQTFELIGTPFTVSAIDGTELNEPGELQGVRLELITGGRYDLTFTMRDRPVLLKVGGAADKGLLLSPDGNGEAPEAPPGPVFRPESYGKPAKTPFHAGSDFDRSFTMILDDKLAFFNGRFGGYQTINGRLFPHTPVFVVREGELVKTTIVNRSAVDHPMHLHGHHLLVLSRNGKPVTGSPWWSDTLDVAPGEWYEIAFRADNPGIWMDHCHNLDHAANGMTMHLMYEGVTTPFAAGRTSGNHSE